MVFKTISNYETSIIKIIITTIISNRDGAALIIGGRNEDGSLRSDVWVLRVTTEADKTLVWEKLVDLELHLGRCAHGAAIIENK